MISAQRVSELESLVRDAFGAITPLACGTHGSPIGWQTRRLWPNLHDTGNDLVLSSWRSLRALGVQAFQGGPLEYSGHSDPGENWSWVYESNAHREICPVFALIDEDDLAPITFSRTGPDSFWENHEGDSDAILTKLRLLHSDHPFAVTLATPSCLHGSFLEPIAPVQACRYARSLMSISIFGYAWIFDAMEVSELSRQLNSRTFDDAVALLGEYLCRVQAFRLYFA